MNQKPVPPTLAGVAARLVERVPELAVLSYLALTFATATDRMAVAVTSMAREIAELRGIVGSPAHAVPVPPTREER